MTATAEAERLLQHLLPQCEQMQASHGKAAAVPISVYETDHDLATLRPEDGGRWTAEFHREVMEQIAASLRLLGYVVRLVPMDAAKYLRWLSDTKQTNSPGNRARFISLQFH
jgi:hypothetical protein